MKNRLMFLALFLIPTALHAGARYSIKPLEFVFAESGPTFRDNGQDYRYVIGGTYMVIAVDDATGESVRSIQEYTITPQDSFPDVTRFQDYSLSDASRKGTATAMSAALAVKAEEKTKAISGRVPAKTKIDTAARAVEINE